MQKCKQLPTSYGKYELLISKPVGARVPEECPEEVRAVIASCRATTPADRPTARQVFDRLRACIIKTQ